MNRGTAIDRTCVVVLKDGSVCVDWGHGGMQDVVTGEFRSPVDDLHTRAITDGELDALVKTGIAVGYDVKFAYLLPLPEGERKTLD